MAKQKRDLCKAKNAIWNDLPQDSETGSFRTVDIRDSSPSYGAHAAQTDLLQLNVLHSFYVLAAISFLLDCCIAYKVLLG